MRLEIIKRLQILVSRQDYALRIENLEYFEELLEDAENCLHEIKTLTNELPLTDQERGLLLEIKEKDEQNRALFNDQFEEVKFKLRTIRMNESKSQQYVNSYGSWQEAGVFFDKRGR